MPDGAIAPNAFGTSACVVCSSLGKPLRGSAPQPLEIVEAPFVRREDVHYHTACVQENPSTVSVAFNSGSAEAAVAQRQRNRIGDGPRLNFRAAGCDHERIGEDAFADEVDRLNVFSLLIERRLAHGLKQIGQKVDPLSLPC